jgi:signal transduction histidine kinase
LGVVLALAAVLSQQTDQVLRSGWELVAWIVTVVITDLLPVPLWSDNVLSLSLPILLAAAMVYSPAIAGGLAFLGSNDVREFKREVSTAHGLYNRSQIATSVMAASAVFRLFHGDLTQWPHVVGIALLMVVADMSVNFTLVVLANRLLHPQSSLSILRSFLGHEPLGFLMSYVSLGLVALLLSVVFREAGIWGMGIFVVPLFLGRQVFIQSRKLRDMANQVADKTRMLLAISEKIADERRDERLTIAAGLHDEVLPPLHKVHLMGQVIRQDLATGRLLDLEDDVPDLLRAAETAGDAMRILIRDLRHSPLGPGGLDETLRLLVRYLSQESKASIHLEIESIGGSPVVQLLAYQVSREAIRNAMRHSGAKNIWVSVAVTDGNLRVIVSDDGRGFDPSQVDTAHHFGLQLMRERVELAGGIFHLHTSPGNGSQVTARFPADLAL